MKVFDLLMEAASSFKTNRVRSSIIVIGVVIGITAIVSATALLGGIRLALIGDKEFSQERLIDISADGEIQNEELEDFVRIQENHERMAMTVDTLQLWSEEMLSSGRIDKEAYEKLKAARG